jgi:hypothetical protein
MLENNIRSMENTGEAVIEEKRVPHNIDPDEVFG